MENQAVTGLDTRINNNILDSINLNSGPTSYNELYKDGVVGINLEVLDQLRDDINTLVKQPIESVLDSFGGPGTFDPGLKGNSNEATIKYVEALKTLIRAYLSKYDTFINLAEQSADVLKENDRINSNLIENAADDILKIAEKISIE